MLTEFARFESFNADAADDKNLSRQNLSFDFGETIPVLSASADRPYVLKKIAYSFIGSLSSSVPSRSRSMLKYVALIASFWVPRKNSLLVNIIAKYMQALMEASY